MDTTSKQQKLSHRAINTILKLSKLVISRALYFVAGICIAVAISVAYAAWNTPVNPGDPLTSTSWNDMVDKLEELDSRPVYCYTYYSTSLTSCVCPTGEINKKNLGSWGFCIFGNWGKNYKEVHLPPGLSCADLYYGAIIFTTIKEGLACVCCK